MTNTVKIQATACDNELSVVASTPAGSSELFHLKSGNGNVVNDTVKPQSILPTGPYTLTAIGLNWGGPADFKVILTDVNGSSTTLSNNGAPLPAGGVWSQSVAIHV